MDSVQRHLWALWRDESGISAVECALLLAFIGGGIVLAADELATAVGGQLNDTAECIETAGATCN